MPRIISSIIILAIFTAYTVFIAANYNLFYFFAQQMQTGWSQQIFADLMLAAATFWIVAIPDARAHRINAWPYVALTVFLGSIAILAYFVHRSIRTKHAQDSLYDAPPHSEPRRPA